jgi:hypothetical protein
VNPYLKEQTGAAPEYLETVRKHEVLTAMWDVFNPHHPLLIEQIPKEPDTIPGSPTQIPFFLERIEKRIGWTGRIKHDRFDHITELRDATPVPPLSLPEKRPARKMDIDSIVASTAHSYEYDENVAGGQIGILVQNDRRGMAKHGQGRIGSKRRPRKHDEAVDRVLKLSMSDAGYSVDGGRKKGRGNRDMVKSDPGKLQASHAAIDAGNFDGTGAPKKLAHRRGTGDCRNRTTGGSPGQCVAFGAKES